MSISILIIVAALTCIAFYVYGLPYLVLGPAAVRQKLEQEEYRLLGGALISIALAVSASPFLVTALISGSETAQVFASNLTSLSWRL